MMEYTKFVRKPFIVDVVEVTLENIEEIAKMVGELRYKDDQPFIQVNRNVVPGVVRVFPGFYMTLMGDNIRCYSKKVFAQQFSPNTPEIENWVNYINEPPKNVGVTDTVEPVPQPEAEEVEAVAADT